MTWQGRGAGGSRRSHWLRHVVSRQILISTMTLACPISNFPLETPRAAEMKSNTAGFDYQFQPLNVARWTLALPTDLHWITFCAARCQCFTKLFISHPAISSLVFLGSLCVLGASRRLSNGCLFFSSEIAIKKRGFVSFSKPPKCTCHFHRPQWEIPPPSHTLQSISEITGCPSSKYKHRRTSALLRNIRNIRICMGKKPIVSVTCENKRISIKNEQLTLHEMCPIYPVWSIGRFMAVLWVVL